MTKKQAILTLSLSTLGAIVLLGWSIVGALVATITTGRFSDFVGSWLFQHATVKMLGVSALIWLPLSLISFGCGCWLFLRPMKDGPSRGLQLLGFALSLLPLIVVGLSPFFAQYDGP